VRQVGHLPELYVNTFKFIAVILPSDIVINLLAPEIYI